MEKNSYLIYTNNKYQKLFVLTKNFFCVMLIFVKTVENLLYDKHGGVEYEQLESK